MRTPRLPLGRSRRILTFALALLVLGTVATPTLRPHAWRGPVPADSALPIDPLAAIAELQQRLSSSSEPSAQARLADLNRLLEVTRSLRRSDGRPIEVRFRYRVMSDGIEAEVTAISETAFEISLNKSCSTRPSHVVVSYLHELTHIAQFAEGRLGYAAPRVAGATRWQAVGNDAVDEAEAYAESFWIAGTRAIDCPESLWGFLAAYHEGWESLLAFVRQERPTLPAYQLRPPHQGAMLLPADPQMELGLRWFLGSVAATHRHPATAQ